MTLEEYEQDWAARSKVEVEWLHEQGVRGGPCTCGMEGCQGWRMFYKGDALIGTLHDVPIIQDAGTLRPSLARIGREGLS